MSSFTDYENEEHAGELVRWVQDHAEGNVAPTVEALIAAIPSVGSSFAHILGDRRAKRNRRETFRIIEAMDQGVRDHPKDMPHLEPDQVSEIVQETYEATIKTSNEEKVKYLLNGVRNTFSGSNEEYRERQYYLFLLRDMTDFELDLLRVVYMEGDPFVEVTGDAPPDQANNLARNTFSMAAFTYERTVDYREPDDGPTLLEVIDQRLSNMSKESIEGASRLLDGKGLTDLAANLERKTIRRVEVTRREPDVFLVRDDEVLRIGTPTVPQSTPIESSKTPIGELFVEHLRGT